MAKVCHDPVFIGQAIHTTVTGIGRKLSTLVQARHHYDGMVVFDTLNNTYYPQFTNDGVKKMFLDKCEELGCLVNHGQINSGSNAPNPKEVPIELIPRIKNLLLALSHQGEILNPDQPPYDVGEWGIQEAQELYDELATQEAGIALLTAAHEDTKYLPVKSNGCLECIYRGHNGGFTAYENRRICCEAPGMRHGKWEHPDKVKPGESPDWCPLISVVQKG